MEPVKIIELKESILADNDQDAERLRQEMRRHHISYLNIMSSPGSGKTSTILALLREIGPRLSCGVMEADIDSDVDARAIEQAGYPVVQLHTGGMCHLDAEMSRQGLRALAQVSEKSGADPAKDAGRDPSEGSGADPAKDPDKSPKLDLVILENVGNLVCPAEFDTGADMNFVILSIPEGDDKPLKYPLVFTKCDAVLINKIDSLPVFDFNMKKCEEYIRMRNKNIRIFPISARTGEGIPDVADYVVEKVK